MNDMAERDYLPWHVAPPVETEGTVTYTLLGEQRRDRHVLRPLDLLLKVRGRKEMFYLTTHSTHFIYGYMASGLKVKFESLTISACQTFQHCCFMDTLSNGYRIDSRRRTRYLSLCRNRMGFFFLSFSLVLSSSFFLLFFLSLFIYHY